MSKILLVDDEPGVLFTLKELLLERGHEPVATTSARESLKRLEGVEAGVEFAKTQGGHGSESRTGEIMKEIMKYGSAARGAIPELKELKDELNAQVKRGGFPGGELNQRRVGAVDEAITSIGSATTHPELRSINKQ